MKKIIFILTTGLLLFSCEKNIEDLNINKTDPTTVEGAALFSGAEKHLVDQIGNPVDNNNSLRYWTQYWGTITRNNAGQYDMENTQVRDVHWDIMYRDVIKHLEQAAESIEASEDGSVTPGNKKNKLAIIQILRAYSYGNLVETYGDIPYSEAMDVNNALAKYDDAKTIYLSLIDILDAALVDLDGSEGSFSPLEDKIYDGDASQWKKFANTLKLKMGMVLADEDPAASIRIVNSAVNENGGIFIDNTDNAGYKYSAPPNNSPMNDHFILGTSPGAVAGKTIVDLMNDLKDPRRATYFNANLNTELGTVTGVNPGTTSAVLSFSDLKHAPQKGDIVFVDDGTINPVAAGTVSASSGSTVTIVNIGRMPQEGQNLFVGDYVGGVIGEYSSISGHSQINDAISQQDSPIYLLSYVEAQFLLAEAAARGGYNLPDTAENYYEEGIRASFDAWGAEGVEDYLANTKVDYNTALGNSTSSPNWKEVIGTQAWLALYNRTFASYVSLRRLDYPVLVRPFGLRREFPVRYLYPNNEQKLNSDNWAAASERIGGDRAGTRLFWDVAYHDWFKYDTSDPNEGK